MNLIIGGDSTIGQALSDYWNEKRVPHNSSTRREEQVSENRPFVDFAKKNVT